MTLVYEFHQEDGEIVCCDSCGFEAPTHGFDWGPPYSEKHDRPKRDLCEFCSATLAGRHTRYSYDDLFSMLRAEIWKASAAAVNMQHRPRAKPASPEAVATLRAAVNVCLDAERERMKKLLPGAPATTYTQQRIEMLEAALSSTNESSM